MKSIITILLVFNATAAYGGVFKNILSDELSWSTRKLGSLSKWDARGSHQMSFEPGRFVNSFKVYQRSELSGGRTVETSFETPVFERTFNDAEPELDLFRDASGIKSIDGPREAVSTYRVEKIEERAVRVQDTQAVKIGGKGTRVERRDLGGNELMISRVPGPTQAYFSLWLPVENYGRIVGWNLSDNGGALKIYTLKKGQVYEYRYAINESPEHRLRLEEQNNRLLNRAEVDQFGFFNARLEIIEPREQNLGPVRGFSVDPSGNEGLGG